MQFFWGWQTVNGGKHHVVEFVYPTKAVRPQAIET